MSETKDQETHTNQMQADTPSGRFFAPVNETMHISGVSWDRKRWELHDASLRDEHRLVISTVSDVWEYPVRKEVVIGSDDRCHVQLNAAGIAPHHVAINTDGELFWFRCLGIGNDVQLDGRTTQEGWLQGGEELRLGDVRVYFMVPDRLRSQARLPMPFESTEIKDHSKVLQAVRSSRLTSTDSCDHLAQLEASSEAAKEVASSPEQSPQESGVVKAPRPLNTKAWWIAIVVFCLGVSSILVAGGLHLRKRQSARHKAMIEKRAAARKAALVAFKQDTHRTQLMARVQTAKQQMAAGRWFRAVKLLQAVLAHGILRGIAKADAEAALAKAQREARAASALQKAQALSLKDGKARQVLDLILQIPADSASAEEARGLRLAVRKELRLQLQMCRVLLQGQKLTAARALLKGWLATVRSPQEAQSLDLTQAHLEAQQLSARLDTDDAGVFEPSSKDQKPAPRGGSHRKDVLEWLSLGKLAFRMGRVAKASDSFTRAMTLTSSPSLRRRAARYLAWVRHYKEGADKGIQAAKSKRFKVAISLLQQAIDANRRFGRLDEPRLTRALADATAQRGLWRLTRKQYALALADLQSASKQRPRHPAVRRGWTQLKAKAKELLVEADVLRSVAPQEYKRLLQRILGMTTPTMATHRKAARLLKRIK